MTDDGAVDAIAALVRAKIDALVALGPLTPEQRDRLAAALRGTDTDDER